MAAGVIGRRLVMAALAAALVIGCGAGVTIQPPTRPPATPLASLRPAIEAARAAIAARLSGGGFSLDAPISGYEPGVPGELQSTPKAVFRVNLTDPNQGWVVIYDCATSDSAVDKGEAMSAYLSTFGHSNYPADAVFAVNVVDTALVFHWWSAQRSSDPDQAAQAFSLVAAVGQSIDVID